MLRPFKVMLIRLGFTLRLIKLCAGVNISDDNKNNKLMN